MLSLSCKKGSLLAASKDRWGGGTVSASAMLRLQHISRRIPVSKNIENRVMS